MPGETDPSRRTHPAGPNGPKPSDEPVSPLGRLVGFHKARHEMDEVFAPDKASLFHPGEVALQRSLGVAGRMAEVGGRIIRDVLPEQHRRFYEQLPFILAASVDKAGDVWPTLLEGRPGFIQSLHEREIVVGALPGRDDPTAVGIRANGAVGLLGIELGSRRRNRANGLVRAVGQDSFSLLVSQSFGNCPQFIRRRDIVDASGARNPVRPRAVTFDHLAPTARAIIERADTFFVASYAERGGSREVDVSHRGGRPGFVRVGAEGILTIPDFAGNFFFNTLGNFLVNPRAGLLFVDFESGDLLQLAGTARIITDSPEIAAFKGAQRLWTFHPKRIVLRPQATGLRWRAAQGGISRRTLATGTWDEAARGARGQGTGGSGQEGGEGRAYTSPKALPSHGQGDDR